MPRAPRIDVPGAIHHVVATGNNRCLIVRDDVDRAAFVARLARVSSASAWDVIAWCLMATHVHLVLRCNEVGLGRSMGRLLGGHARRFNERHDLEGHLWQARYFDSIVDDESYLVTSSVYVDLNPVRAELCDHPRSYRWCGYGATVTGEAAGAFRPDLLLATIDADPARARLRYARIVDKEAALLVAVRPSAVPASQAGTGGPSGTRRCA